MFENTLKLESNVMRYIVKVGLKSMLGFRKRECDAIIDTGCKTTLCPLSIAKLFGTKRNISQNIHIGGRIYQSQIYVLNTIILDKLTIQHLPVFACDYRGSIRDSLLIGCNVLKQLKFLV
ncbi:MAG: hypothetical protein FWG65_08175, partial [Turicibacter sp.]|nr:hypothetical protein [Turicibacter sp.]